MADYLIAKNKRKNHPYEGLLSVHSEQVEQILITLFWYCYWIRLIDY